MNPKRIVQFAVLCLELLDSGVGKPMSYQEISRKLGIPLNECERVLRCLSHAGIVKFAEGSGVILLRPVEEITALEILEAVWAPEETRCAFQMLVGAERGPALRKTLEFVRRIQRDGKDSIING